LVSRYTHGRPGKTGGGAEAKCADQSDQCKQKQRQTDGYRHGSTRQSAAGQQRQRKCAKECSDDQEQATHSD
jgi:hypothetical protein